MTGNMEEKVEAKKESRYGQVNELNQRKGRMNERKVTKKRDEGGGKGSK